MNTEKRTNKGYKIKQSIYDKAMRRASREKGALANLIENVVIAYAYGMSIRAETYDKAGNPEIETVANHTDWPKFLDVKR